MELFSFIIALSLLSIYLFHCISLFFVHLISVAEKKNCILQDNDTDCVHAI